ncbi:MAG: hypothetical protein L3K26_15320 [Candidatus Hydrogenedentes bacterium]|nr:hypothetical protein [Candidatus Hydrogenedentota bacterium]
MNNKFWQLTLILAMAWAPLAGAASMTIDDDGMAVVDGERTFILGLYENPKDDAVLQGAVKAGVNLLRSSATAEALDRLADAGAWAWLNTGATIDLSVDSDAREKGLATMVEKYAPHPALLVWEVPDEALWNTWWLARGWRLGTEASRQREFIAALTDTALADKLRADQATIQDLYRQGKYVEADGLGDSIWIALGKKIPKPGYGLSTAPARAKKMGDGMLAGYKMLRALDVNHPVWMNHAPRNTIQDLAFFNRAADIVGCDIYPVPEDTHVKHSDLGNRSLASVGDYTKRMQATAPDKPVWMVLQGTGWKDFGKSSPEREALRRPTKAESRFMAYDAIVHGARGILYWGTQFVEKDSVFWLELLEVIAELDTLQPVLTAPDATIQPQVSLAPSYGSGDRGVDVLAKSRPEGDWLLVVNTWSEPLTATISGFDAKEKTAYRIAGQQETFPVENGGVTLSMPRYSVLVLEPVAGT